MDLFFENQKIVKLKPIFVLEKAQIVKINTHDGSKNKHAAWFLDIFVNN